MEWTQEHRKFVRQTMKRFANRTSPQHMNFLIKTHLHIDAGIEEVAKLIKEIQSESPPPSVVLMTTAKKTRDLRASCMDIINEAKTLIAAEGQHKVAAKLSDEGISAVLMLSDLHIGEVIKVNDEAIFDLNIAKTKLSTIVDKFMFAPELSGYDSVDEAVVLLGGDIIDGELIYASQAYETSGHAFDQIKAATLMIWEQLVRISSLFPRVKVYCVPGNHGRSTKQNHPMSNWDNVLYFGLQVMANIQKGNIEVHTPSQMWMDFKVRHWNVHMRHIGVTQAVSAGPAKRVLTWMDGHNADLLFFGHFHSPEMYSLAHRRVFKNGALPPANDFAENLGFLDGTGQWMVGITNSQSVAFAKVLLPNV